MTVTIVNTTLPGQYYPIDSEPIQNSPFPVASGGVYAALASGGGQISTLSWGVDGSGNILNSLTMMAVGDKKYILGGRLHLSSVLTTWSGTGQINVPENYLDISDELDGTEILAIPKARIVAYGLSYSGTKYFVADGDYYQWIAPASLAEVPLKYLWNFESGAGIYYGILNIASGGLTNSLGAIVIG